MPQMTSQEWEHINRLSNIVFDILYMSIGLDEEVADRIAREVIDLVVKRAENK